MAGAYADAPSRRMATDADGTVGVYHGTLGGGASSGLTSGQMSILNDETDTPAAINGNSLGTAATLIFLFPELRELDGIFAAGYHFSGTAPSLGAVDSSADTTQGRDGTWNNQVADLTNWTFTYVNFRDEIVSLAVATEKGIRVAWARGSTSLNGIASIHLYGVISPGETPDRILFLDTLAADAVFTKVLDFGDVPRGQTQTRTFKIKNNSSTYTINTIQVTAEDLYLNAGDWYTFGIDDITYAATYAAGNLGTGATLLLYMKQIIPDGETLGVQTGRIKVSHASLT